MGHENAVIKTKAKRQEKGERIKGKGKGQVISDKL
jgi:hypothetical protein